MTDDTLKILVTGIPAIIAAIFSGLAAVIAAFALLRGESRGKEMAVVHEKVNGITTSLVDAAKAAANAEGQLQGQNDERERQEGG
jgi:hypothetical protein